MAPDHHLDTTIVDNLEVGAFNQFNKFLHISIIKGSICCKFIGLARIVDNIATESMDLPFVFSWFTGPAERKGVAARVGSEGLSAAFIYEGK